MSRKDWCVETCILSLFLVLHLVSEWSTSSISDFVYRLRSWEEHGSYEKLIDVQKLVIDVSKFGHWKVKIRHVIQSIDEKIWDVVMNRWSEPTIS